VWGHLACTTDGDILNPRPAVNPIMSKLVDALYPNSCVIYPINLVSKEVGNVILNKIKEALALFFSPANRDFGQKPQIMEVIDIIQKADSRIRYFDAGDKRKDAIEWFDCDIEYFNPISFAWYDTEKARTSNNIYIANDWLTD
jgi:hypothetical protein